VDDPLAVHALADSGMPQQLRAPLLEDACANALLAILAVATLQHDRLDAFELEQSSEREACRAGADDPDLCSHRFTDGTVPIYTVPMAQRTSPPFRADHVGSLLRPRRLLDARDEHAAGRIDGDELRAIEDEAIRDAVRMQEDVGLQSATDGEFRRASWHMDFIYQLEGITKEAGHISVKFHNPEGDIEFTPAALHVDGPLDVAETIFGDDFRFLQQTVTTATPKLTIPSPSMVHYRGGKAAIDPAVYPDLESFWAGLTGAYRKQVDRLGELGCTYLQIDDTSLAYLNDPHQREYVASIGGDPERQHIEYIHHINEALASRPAGMSVTTHMCRGNFRSSWAAEGGYDFVAEALFGELDVDGFFMEWDDERSGGFAPLRFLPKGKQVVLGLVTTKRGELEEKDEIKRRIDEAARHVDVDQLCLSPQCGFSSTVEGNALTSDEEIAKLRLIVDVARDVWG
jgi:5-methyltetrahydropteroyltriglutamate--homocysteine methyltransferase